MSTLSTCFVGQNSNDKISTVQMGDFECMAVELSALQYKLISAVALQAEHIRKPAMSIPQKKTNTQIIVIVYCTTAGCWQADKAAPTHKTVSL